MDPSKTNAPRTPASGAAIQRRATTRARSLTAVWAVAAIAAGCGVGADPGAQSSVGVTTQASVTTPQTLLDGNAIPKFVDPLPTFNGRRINGSATLNVSMQEFQQRVLPASVYTGLPAPFNAGTFLWGYNINNTGASWPARTIEVTRGTATTAIYTNNLRNTRLQSLLTVDQSLHWADPLGTTARNNCVNGPPLAAPARSPTRARSPRSCTCTAPRFCRSTTEIRTPGSRPACCSAGAASSRTRTTT